MKYLLPIPVLVAAVVAQGGLSGCGLMCWNNMLDQASALGCTTGDLRCLCSRPDFQYGLNDCSSQACGEAVHGAVAAFGRSQCGNVAAQGGTPAGGATTPGPPPATTTETTLPTGTTTETTVTAGGHNSTTATATAGAGTSGTTTRTATGTTATAGGAATTSIQGPATSTNLAMKVAGSFAGAGAIGLAAVLLPLI